MENDTPPGPTIGDRVAYYRRLNRMSAEELAADAGEGLTRSMLANLENGRKLDVTVGQMISLAKALGVPPAALVFDLHRPLAAGRSSDLVDEIAWFSGADPTPWRRAWAGDVAYEIISLLNEQRGLTADVARMLGEIRTSELRGAPAEYVDRQKRDVAAMQEGVRLVTKRLAEMGVEVDG